MALEMTSELPVCTRCGRKYGRVKGYFPVSYAMSYKGAGHLHICKDCVDSMFSQYLAETNDPKKAVRQMCRKLDIYWSDHLYDLTAEKTANRSMMTQYIAKSNTKNVIGKSYDDTLKEEGTLWTFTPGQGATATIVGTPSVDKEDIPEISDEIKELWGKGYSNDMYAELEQRWQYWMSKYPEGTELDIGAEALLRQICSLELDIKRDRIAGKPVDKSVNALNQLLGSAQLRPGQQVSASEAAVDGTPLGVWIKRYETQRPIPEPDPELEDVDHVTKYVLTWVYGHLAKMLNIKNARSRLYDEAIEKLRVDHPEFDEDDDEDFLYDIFGDEEAEDEQ